MRKLRLHTPLLHGALFVKTGENTFLGYMRGLQSLPKGRNGCYRQNSIEFSLLLETKVVGENTLNPCIAKFFHGC